MSKWYCIFCKKYYDEEHARLISRLGSRRHYFVCPTCNSILKPVCTHCSSGAMLKPSPPVSGDFDTDGRLEHFCSSCGAGYLHITIGAAVSKAYISKTDIRKLVDKVFTRLQLAYSEKSEVEERIFRECATRQNIIDLLSLELGENTAFLNTEIAGLIVSFSSNR